MDRPAVNLNIRNLLLSLVIGHCAFWHAGIAASQAFIPEDNNFVVENLSSSTVRLSQQIRSAEAIQQSRPSDAITSNSVFVSQIIEAYSVAINSQDPQAYGRVMALFEQWPENQEKPALLHIIHAAVLQHRHDFSRALQETDSALASDSGTDQLTMQAQMIRAQIGLVTADYDLTRRSCEALMTLASRATYVNCAAQLDGVTGNAEQALQAATSMLANASVANQQERIELQVTAATLAHRLGDVESARNYYRQVLVQSPQHFYTLVNYANLLLEQNRAPELVNLLKLYPEKSLNTELNILLAEALMLTADTENAETIVLALENEFELAFVRGEAIPYKEYARYSLSLRPQPADALSAALENWSQQKEPSDALLLARAAALKNDLAVLAELKHWIERNGMEDRRLESIFAQQGV